MPPADVEPTLLAAARLGLADGQRAFILMDTSTALNASSQLAMAAAPFLGGNSSGGVELVAMAAEALLIVKAHAVSLVSVSDTSYEVLSLTWLVLVRNGIIQ